MKYFFSGPCRRPSSCSARTALWLFRVAEPQRDLGRRHNADRSGALLFGAMGLLAVGCCSRWARCRSILTPDVYQGAPTPSPHSWRPHQDRGRGCVARVFYVALGGRLWDWQPLFAVIAVLTMVVGTLLAITQTDIKRMLAYSPSRTRVPAHGRRRCRSGRDGGRSGQLTSVGRACSICVPMA